MSTQTHTPNPSVSLLSFDMKYQLFMGFLNRIKHTSFLCAWFSKMETINTFSDILCVLNLPWQRLNLPWYCQCCHNLIRDDKHRMNRVQQKMYDLQPNKFHILESSLVRQKKVYVRLTVEYDALDVANKSCLHMNSVIVYSYVELTVNNRNNKVFYCKNFWMKLNGNTTQLQYHHQSCFTTCIN